MIIKRISLVMIFVTYVLIVFGGYVASSESGMGCGPEWPLCNGKVVPILQGETLIEFTHRLIGAVLGILSLWLFIQVLRSNRERKIRLAAYWMISLLAVQVVFGAIVVWLDLPTFMITAHLIAAMAYFYFVIFMWKASSFSESTHHHYKRDQICNRLTVHLNLMMGLLIVTIALGAYVKHNHYGLACDWFACGEALLPTNGGQWLQTLHRVMALGTSIYSFVLVFWGYAHGISRDLCKRLELASFLVLLQVAIGVMTILSFINLSWAVVHMAVGTLLLATVFETRIFLQFYDHPVYGKSNPQNHHSAIE